MARSSSIGLPPFLVLSNLIIWISAVIVMGILSYFIHVNTYVGRHIIYEEVIVRFTPNPPHLRLCSRSAFVRTRDPTG